MNVYLRELSKKYSSDIVLMVCDGARWHLLCRFEKVATEKESQERFLYLLKRQIESANAYVMAQGQEGLAGVAISAPGRIDSENGVMHTGGSNFAIDHLRVKDLPEEMLHLPVTVENDARCAALAESWQGALQGCRMGVTFIIGTGIGGGIVYQGQVLHGTHLLAGEFSYLMTNAAEWQQRHQLLAEQGGVPALIETAARVTGADPARLNGEIIFQRAENGDSQYRAAMRITWMRASSIRWRAQPTPPTRFAAMARLPAWSCRIPACSRGGRRGLPD